MFRVSNIVILAMVITAHWGIVHALFASQTQKSDEQNLAIASTILEMTLIEASEASPSAPSIASFQKAAEAPLIISTKTPNSHHEISPHHFDSKDTTKIEEPLPNDRTIEHAENRVKTEPVPNTPPSLSSDSNQDNRHTNRNNSNGNSTNNNNNNRNGHNNLQGASINRHNNASNRITNAGNDHHAQTFTPVTHEGAALGNKRPQYPELSIRRKEEGKVRLLAHVLPSGRAQYVKIDQSSGFPRLDNAALKAAEKYQYQPATQNGQKISYDYRFTVTFKIERY